MNKLGVILAVVALGVGGWGATQLCEKDEQIEALAEANRDLQDRLTTIEVALREGQPARPEAALRTAGDTTPEHGTSAPAGLTGRAASPLERLAALEKQVEEQDTVIAKLNEEKSALDKAHSAVRRYNTGSFYGNLDMAAKSLDLKETQRSDLGYELERAQKELADLRKLENDEGETLEGISKPKMVKGSGFAFAMPDMAKIRKFKKSRIPGSSETFGEAEKRIRKDAFGRMRNVLTPAQAAKWDKASKDAMLGGGGAGQMAVTFVGVGSDG